MFKTKLFIIKSSAELFVLAKEINTRMLILNNIGNFDFYAERPLIISETLMIINCNQIFINNHVTPDNFRNVKSIILLSRPQSYNFFLNWNQSNNSKPPQIYVNKKFLENNKSYSRNVIPMGWLYSTLFRKVSENVR